MFALIIIVPNIIDAGKGIYPSIFDIKIDVFYYSLFIMIFGRCFKKYALSDKSIIDVKEWHVERFKPVH